jgi:hypothetical protein
MLRMPASKIELSHRDLTWHKQRFNQRKVEHETLKRRSLASKKQKQNQPSKVAVEANTSDNSIDKLLCSGKPSGKGADAFWASVMAHALSPRVEMPSLQTQSEDHSNTANGSEMQLYHTTFSDLSAHEEPEMRPSFMAETANSRLRSSSTLSAGKENEEETTTVLQRGAQPGSSVCPARDEGRKMIRESPDYQKKLDPVGLDGIKDSTSGLNKMTLGHLPHAGPSVQASGPVTAPLLQSVEKLRVRSGHLPRSPLHIAQAAASSSPDKHSVKSSSPISAGASVAGLLSLPPRRPGSTRSKCLSRQQDNFDISPSDCRVGRRLNAVPYQVVDTNDEILEQQSQQSGDQPERSFCGASTSILPRNSKAFSPNESWSASTPSPQRRTTWDYLSIHAYSRRARSSANTDSADQSLTPLFDQSSDNGPSSPILPSLPIRSSRHAFGDLPPSSPPFHPISPRNNHAPSFPTMSEALDLNQMSHPGQDQAQNSSHLSSSVESLQLPDPAQPSQQAPRTPRTPARSIRVYDDSIPAASQPQTPLGLPRHGIPPMSMAGSFTTTPIRRTGGPLAHELTPHPGLTTSGK